MRKGIYNGGYVMGKFADDTYEEHKKHFKKAMSKA